jgi:hypothetical protein
VTIEEQQMEWRLGFTLGCGSSAVMVALLSWLGFEAKDIAFGLFVGLATSVVWTVAAAAYTRN